VFSPDVIPTHDEWTGMVDSISFFHFVGPVEVLTMIDVPPNNTELIAVQLGTAAVEFATLVVFDDL